jgi:hypothetical protein
MAKIRGEYWIQGGQVEFADGDVGDQNHEMVALNSIAADHVDRIMDYAQELGLDTEDLGIHDEPFTSTSELLEAIRYALLERGVASIKVAELIIKKLGINMEVYKLLGGGGDARLYVMKNEGWIAVRSNNIELFGYDANKKGQLSSGIEEILEQESIEEPDDQIEFSVYDHKTNRSFDATLADIKNTNSFARPQQLPNTTYNKPLFVPADRATPMGSQSPKTIGIQQRQAMQTSEGKIGFKKWLEKEPGGFLIRRKWPI